MSSQHMMCKARVEKNDTERREMIDDSEHRDLSQGFKCMAEMINRMMYLVIIFILTSVFAYFVLANFPFGLREDRIKRLDLDDLCGL